MTFTNDKGHTQHEVSTKNACWVQRLCARHLGVWCCTRAGWLRISHQIIELRSPVPHQCLLSWPRYCGPAPHKPSRAALMTATHCGLWRETGSFWSSCSCPEKQNSPTQPALDQQCFDGECLSKTQSLVHSYGSMPWESPVEHTSYCVQPILVSAYFEIKKGSTDSGLTLCNKTMQNDTTNRCYLPNQIEKFCITQDEKMVPLNNF